MTLSRSRPFAAVIGTLPALAALLAWAALTPALAGAQKSTAKGPDYSQPLITAPSPDPRVGLKAGVQDAGEAIWNLKMLSHTPPPADFAGVTNSDLAFHGTDVIQGN
jgi:hypothetical protein